MKNSPTGHWWLRVSWLFLGLAIALLLDMIATLHHQSGVLHWVALGASVVIALTSTVYLLLLLKIGQIRKYRNHD